MSSYHESETTSLSPPAGRHSQVDHAAEEENPPNPLSESAVLAAAQAFALLLGADTDIFNITEFREYYRERVKHWADVPLQQWSDCGSSQILHAHAQVVENIHAHIEQHQDAARFESLVDKEDKELLYRRKTIEKTRDKLIKKCPFREAA
ncbi:hypothetical protein B0H13DRAFT_2310864 [Mycena leptocephala]|nr:hypothetical protein B0H13DRAFT_2310864 [Mycena leptocephala]